MTLYPRRDVVYVAVSPAEGGCGASHVRPVTHGAPDQDWVLNCPPCERHLIKDPHWSGTRHDVPETPDETAKRESLVKQKDRSLEEITALALQKISEGGMLSRPQEQIQPALCKSGHSNLPHSRFCGECGIPLAGDSPSNRTMVIPADVAEEDDVVIKRGKLLINPTGEELSKLPVSELRELAKKRNIDPAQSKKSLIAELS